MGASADRTDDDGQSRRTYERTHRKADGNSEARDGETHGEYACDQMNAKGVKRLTEKRMDGHVTDGWRAEPNGYG